MTNNVTKTAAAVVATYDAATLKDAADFMAATYPAKAGDKWDANLGGPLPVRANHLGRCRVWRPVG
jgi:hypothetical protein